MNFNTYKINDKVKISKNKNYELIFYSLKTFHSESKFLNTN
jgi:hypothetical protein